MSVVNDVLRDLNQRHARENMARHMPYFQEAKPVSQYILWVVLGITLSISLVLAVFQWQQPKYMQQSIELPSNLFVLDASHVSSDADLMPIPMAVKKEPAQLPIPQTSVEKITFRGSVNNHLPVQNAKSMPAKSKPNNGIVSKSQQSESVDQVVAALKVGNHKAVQADLGKTPKLMRDEIKLRIMVKEQPEKVLPYINNNFSDYSKNPNLLAMAAQSQQRIQQHFSAISIYKQLIKIQPKDARWRAGIAISLEASGEVKAAMHMYKLALSMPGLPRSLAAFSQKRLSTLK